MSKHPAAKMSYDRLMDGLQKEVRDKYINCREHGDLRLFNYSNKAQFDKRWNSWTLVARGLIIDIIERKIVAYPFPKFFNFGEKSSHLPECGYVVTEKMDGSLGIIFHYQDEWHVATRGSFESTQAAVGKRLLEQYNLDAFEVGTTYLTEIVSPATRVIVDYGQKEFLSLLGAYNSYGIELSMGELDHLSAEFGMPRPVYFEGDFFDLVERVKDWPREQEGVVVRFDDGYRVKIKSTDYLALAKILAGFGPLPVWEALRDMSDLEAIKEKLPDEFLKEFDGYVDTFTEKFERILARIAKLYVETESLSAKELGLKVGKNKGLYSHVFNIRNGKFDPHVAGKTRWGIFQMFRPTGNLLK